MEPSPENVWHAIQGQLSGRTHDEVKHFEEILLGFEDVEGFVCVLYRMLIVSY